MNIKTNNLNSTFNNQNDITKDIKDVISFIE